MHRLWSLIDVWKALNKRRESGKASQAPVVRAVTRVVLGGLAAMVNKSSTTWRQLPDNRKAAASDAEWKLLLREHPALIKRPLVVMDDGCVSQGFSDNGFKKLFGVG